MWRTLPVYFQIAVLLVLVVSELAIIAVLVGLIRKMMRVTQETALIANDSLEATRKSNQVSQELLEVGRRQIELQSASIRQMGELTEALKTRS